MCARSASSKIKKNKLLRRYIVKKTVLLVITLVTACGCSSKIFKNEFSNEDPQIMYTGECNHLNVRSQYENCIDQRRQSRETEAHRRKL